MALTWEAAPAHALVNTMATVVMTTTVGIVPIKAQHTTSQFQLKPHTEINGFLFFYFTAHCGYLTEAPTTGKILNIKNKPSEIIVHYSDTCAMLSTFSGTLWRLSFWLWRLYQPKLPQLLP